MTDIPIASPRLGEAEAARVASVLESGQLADGPVVREFEAAFADEAGAAHGVATTNGTTALHTALEALGIGRGDTVLTTPFSFVATANAVRFVGATPVFADIDPATYNLDPAAAEAVLEARGGDVDALLVVHLYGLPAPMDRFDELARAYDCALLVDAAQAHGARLEGDPVGSHGDAACFSFYPTKNMTTGEGGMVVTDEADVAERARRFVNHGRTDTYEHASLGHNFRLPSVAAAMGLAQLERLPGFVERRRENAGLLRDHLADVPGLVLPVEPAGARHAYHQFTVRASDRDGLAAHLEAHGIGTGIYYPKPIPALAAYADVEATVPRADRAAEEVLSLPVHPDVTPGDVERIASVVKQYPMEATARVR